MHEANRAERQDTAEEPHCDHDPLQITNRAGEYVNLERRILQE